MEGASETRRGGVGLKRVVIWELHGTSLRNREVILELLALIHHLHSIGISGLVAVVP